MTPVRRSRHVVCEERSWVVWLTPGGGSRGRRSGKLGRAEPSKGRPGCVVPRGRAGTAIRAAPGRLVQQASVSPSRSSPHVEERHMVAVCTTVRTVPAAPQRELCEKSLFEEPGQLGERLRRPDHRFRSEAGRGCLCCLEAMPLAALDQVPAGHRQCHLVLTA